MMIFNSILLVTDSDYRLIFSILSSLIGAIVGGLITIWYKKKEIKNLSDNLNLQFQNLELQKKVFKESSKNNELKMKAELVRLEDLNRKYHLSLQQYDFEHLSRVLDFAGDSNEKVKMLKEFSSVLETYTPEMYFVDTCEYEEVIKYHVYYKLKYIEDEIKRLLKNYPNVFIGLHSAFKQVASDANYLISFSSEIQFDEEIDTEQIINQLGEKSLMNLHDNFLGLLDKMKEEFLELDTIKREYIRDQYKNRIKD